ncbi:MAG: metabolite traffic protein EboE [Pseudomonadota bacterium]
MSAAPTEQSADEDARLCYCANVHPGESLEDAIRIARTHGAAVKAMVSPEAPMGYGLRLTAEAAAEAVQEPARLAALRDALAETGLVAFTVNGFPYGPFHGRPVKEAVYRPDWRTPERLRYTIDLAEAMAALSHETDLSLSTVPGAFRPDGIGAEARIAETMIAFVAHAAALEARTGKTVRLAIEPEPECLLETTAEAIAFFEAHLFSTAAVAALGERAGLSRAAAETALRRHLGLCFDVCHAAVEFEDPDASLDALEAAGIGVYKLQLSAALSIPRVDAAARSALAAYDEPTYLHQVVVRDAAGALTRRLDLGVALAQAAKGDGEAEGDAWRVHFHAPVFAAAAPPFETTQADLIKVLERQARRPISRHLEIETYTWGVLPPALRAASVEAMIAQEIFWVRDQLARAADLGTREAT